jgi:molybdopterin-guanine dinucleotide biosynthesis protein A
MNVLLIVAAGKSSRFGGFPKAFCQIGRKTNVENTAFLARKYFDSVFLGVNEATYEIYGKTVPDVLMFPIKAGQGDAHSLLKCLKHIKTETPDIKEVTVCWGDAFFVDDSPFRETLEGCKKTNQPIIVSCAIDPRPYAWFDTNSKGEILRSHFSRNEPSPLKGLHDQSLFTMNVDFAITELEKYRQFLAIPEENKENYVENDEMKLLNFFTFLSDSDTQKAYSIQVTPKKVLSFNSKEELQSIINNRMI